IEIVAGDTRWLFDREAGLLTSWKRQDEELLTRPLRPNFWRAPTDNDRGNNMPNRLAVWRDAGDQWRATSVALDDTSPACAKIVADGEIPTVPARYTLTYWCCGTGDLVVEASLAPADDKAPELPRFGMQVQLTGAFERIAWFGRGPEETYSDRCDARVGLYDGAIADQFCVDYSEPGETGNKVDTRWIALTGANGVGLLATGAPRLSVSALPFSASALEGPKHPYEIQPSDAVSLCLDLTQMGVAGDDSWGALPHAAYRIPAGPLTYRFRLRAFDAGRIPMEVVRRNPAPSVE
ncbi:MAG: hypothetical protein KDA33_11750, partial [Phycisphaerales bacterium]|nr:hypothetical protein [Phycisphaerales bacterium]